MGAVKDWWGRGQASVRAAVGRASQPSSSCLCWGDARDDEEVDERGGGTPRSILFFFLVFSHSFDSGGRTCTSLSLTLLILYTYI